MGECQSNCNGNCKDTVTGYPPIGKTKQASVSEASIALCDQLKFDVPQVHVSRRLSSRGAVDPCFVDVQLKSHVQTAELKIPEHENIGDEKKHVRSEEENRCRDDDVCLGSGSGDEGDDHACVPLRSCLFIFLSIA